MIILGIDPGTATSGYGIVSLRAGKLGFLEYGVFRTEAGLPLPERLHRLYTQTNRLLDEFNPDVMAVEQLFFSRNATSALSVGQARGIFLLAAAQRGMQVAEYTPMQVKQGVSGEGNADKAQVAFMVRALLSLDHLPKPDDAADALAIAICHAHTVGAKSRALEITQGGSGVWT